MQKIVDIEKITDRKLSKKQSAYLVKSRFSIFIYLFILKLEKTYMSEIEKYFLEFGSRNSLLKCIKELDQYGFIKIKSDSNKKIKYISVNKVNWVNGVEVNLNFYKLYMLLITSLSQMIVYTLLRIIYIMLNIIYL